MMSNNKVKISVEDFEGSHEELCEIDKNQSLPEIIAYICHILRKPETSKIYGLKLMKTNDGKFLNSYISEDNLNDIKDAYSLKLVYSISYYIKRIFDYIEDPDYKVRSYEDLYNLSVDPEFIKELVKVDKHFVLISHFTENKDLRDKNLTACLISIVHLFQKGFINEISSQFLEKIIAVLNSPENSIESVKYALSVLHKIMYHRDSTFTKWKAEIIKRVSINDLTPYIWSDERHDLQYGALLLINTIVKYCQGEMRQKLIKEINLRQNREYIYTHIVLPGNVDKNIAHELYVYQTYTLSSYAEPLNTLVTITEEIREDFEIEDEEIISRRSILLDFEEENLNKLKNASIENLADMKDDLRISIASGLSDEASRTSRTTSLVENENSLVISNLTLKALSYYKSCYQTIFRQSQIEEKIYEPGIFVTSERVVKMLAKMFHIGREPEKTSTFYQPTVFNCSSGTPFFFEIFSRTMWLLSKTRREMKASTMEDYPKVMRVLQQQLKLALDEKPLSFGSLTAKLSTVSFHIVLKYWQKEKESEMNALIENHPCVQEIKEQYKKHNEELIFQQRLNYVQKWTAFPKIEEKKASGDFATKLSKNNRQLITRDFDSNKQIFLGDFKTYSVADIKYVVVGKACPHVKNKIVKKTTLAFSLIFDDCETINFVAKDEKMASCWVDAMNLLLEKEARSELYQKELADLVKMDLLLHLLEIQNLTIPKNPPPIPPLPKDCLVRPPLPPKPVISK